MCFISLLFISQRGLLCRNTTHVSEGHSLHEWRRLDGRNLLYIVINIKQVSKYISLYQTPFQVEQATRETTSPDQFHSSSTQMSENSCLYGNQNKWSDGHSFLLSSSPLPPSKILTICLMLLMTSVLPLTSWDSFSRVSFSMCVSFQASFSFSSFHFLLCFLLLPPFHSPSHFLSSSSSSSLLIFGSGRNLFQSRMVYR